MKQKRCISLLIACLLCLSSAVSLAVSPDSAPGVSVEWMGKPMTFDVEPVLENGRTMVPFRGIFEAMGCVVSYAEEDGAQVVTAHRGDDSLLLVIGEPALYFNEEKTDLDVAPYITQGRTLVPLRAISEAFDCDVDWEDATRKVSIHPPAGHFTVTSGKLEKTILSSNGSPLLEAVAYYPIFSDESHLDYLEELNEEYQKNAETFLKEALAKEEEAAQLLEEMGEAAFLPYTFSLTYEISHNIGGLLSVRNFSYSYLGGTHPTTMVESRNFLPGSETELCLADILDEEALGSSLRDYLYPLFCEMLAELGVVPDEDGTYSVIDDELGSVQYYFDGTSLVLYFNPYQVAPYAAGMPGITIPYDPQTFLVDLRGIQVDAYTFNLENDAGYEWVLADHTEEAISVTQEYTQYPEESRLSEYYPVGNTKYTVTGLQKGNGTLTLAHVEIGKDLATATQIRTFTFFVDEQKTITVVTETEEIR